MKFRGFLHVLLAAACLLAPVGAAAQNVKISAMPAASALDGTELYAGVQGGANVKVTGAQIKTLTSASPTLVTPNLGTPSAGVMTNVTGTAAGLTAGNASQLIGGTWAIPGSIGATTPNAGAFTSLTASTTANVTGILTTQSGQVVKLRVVTASGAVTVATTDDIVVMKKTVPATTVINLPASPTTGQRFTFKDGQGDWSTFNVTLTPAAGNIDGTATKAGNINWQSLTVVYDGVQWEII